MPQIHCVHFSGVSLSFHTQPFFFLNVLSLRFVVVLMFLRESGCQYIQTPGENTIADSKEGDTEIQRNCHQLKFKCLQLGFYNSLCVHWVRWAWGVVIHSDDQ